MSELTHFDEAGRPRMVDVGGKAVTERLARAKACVLMRRETLSLIQSQRTPTSAGNAAKIGNRNEESIGQDDPNEGKVLGKGDVLEVSRVAGIMAAKNTSSLIPLCHPLSLSAVNIDFRFVDEVRLEIESTVRLQGQTGAEMEALLSASVAALTVYDMCKAVDRGMVVEFVRLEEKSGGKSGHFRRVD